MSGERECDFCVRSLEKHREQVVVVVVVRRVVRRVVRGSKQELKDAGGQSW